MRKNLLLIVAVLAFAGLHAQSGFGPMQVLTGGVPTLKRVANPELMQNLRAAAPKNSLGSRATTTKFYLDYDVVDNEFANINSQDYQSSVWQVNRRFPNDSSFTNRWAAVVFDTLFDYSSGVYPFRRPPYSSVRLTIDSLYIPFAHIKTSPSFILDTVIVSIYNGDTLNTITNADGLRSQVLWTDTLYFDTTQTGPGTTPGTYRLSTLALPVGLALAKGQKFGVQVDYLGPVDDEFLVLAGYRDGCADACAGMKSVVPSRFGAGESSFSLFVYKQGATAFQTINHNVTLDCNGNGTIEDNLCENFFIQNINIIPVVTAVTDLSASIIADKNTGCPGEIVNLDLEVYGASGTPTITWSPSTGLDNPNIEDPKATIGASNVTYTATIRDGVDSFKINFTVNSRGVAINLGPDKVISCGATTNISGTLSGSVTGATYRWNTGATSAALNNVGAGNYTVTVTNATGCTATDNIVVGYPGVTQVVSFNVPSPICVNREVTFPNTSLKKSGWNFTWTETVTSVTSFLTDGKFTFPTAGNFNIRLEADSAGCKFTTSSPITVRPSADPLCLAGSINNTELSQLVSIYPNPSTGLFEVSIEGVNGKVEMTIVDLTGKAVYVESVNASSTLVKKFDLQGLAKGSYFVKIVNGDRSALKKLTIN